MSYIAPSIAALYGYGCAAAQNDAAQQERYQFGWSDPRAMYGRGIYGFESRVLPIVERKVVNCDGCGAPHRENEVCSYCRRGDD